jgi:hypothetical protein
MGWQKLAQNTQSSTNIASYDWPGHSNVGLQAGYKTTCPSTPIDSILFTKTSKVLSQYTNKNHPSKI